MTNVDYSDLSKRLTQAYTKSCLEYASKEIQHPPSFSNPSERNVVSTVLELTDCLRKYKEPIALDAVLDTIDLPKIYGGLEEREKKQETKYGVTLGYEDLLVMEALKYFREDFFKWVDKPPCPTCNSTDNVSLVSRSGFPSGKSNPDDVSAIEHFKCAKCQTSIDFPRVNNPVSLLSYRKGRCGEWVNCFLLILHALIQPNNNRLRYVWNAEDHVWCEYYSTSLRRWIHLDPCENAYDNPHLYCDNWGKKMSLVVGINDAYVVDLSAKYITDDKRIPKTISTNTLSKLIKFINFRKLLIYFQEYIQNIEGSTNVKLNVLYTQVIVVRNKEKLNLEKDVKIEPSSTHTSITGRQSGSAEWTSSRGEGGAS